MSVEDETRQEVLYPKSVIAVLFWGGGVIKWHPASKTVSLSPEMTDFYWRIRGDGGGQLLQEGPGKCLVHAGSCSSKIWRVVQVPTN